MLDPTATCSITTSRLAIAPWHEAATSLGVELADVVARVLTPVTTRELPTSWQGAYDRERAARWIAECDASASMLLAAEGARPVGMVLLAPVDTADSLDVRIGYVLAEAAWGRGLASELVGGLVGWAAQRPEIVGLTGGVAATNPASARVLVKNGFQAIEVTDEQVVYRRSV